MGKRFIYACKYGVIYIELIFMECLITRWHVVLIPYNEFGPNHSRIMDIAGKICDTIFVYCSWVAVVRTLVYTKGKNSNMHKETHYRAQTGKMESKTYKTIKQ